MSLELLKKQLADKNLGRLYYIHGDEAYLKHFYLSEMKKLLFDKESVGFDFIQLDASSSAEEFLSHLDTFPALAKKKMILITDITEKSDIPQLIVKSPELLCDDTVIVFFEQTATFSKKTKEGKAFGDFLTKKAVDVKINRLDASTLIKWIKKQCKLRGSEICDETAQYLLSVTGTEMFALLHECEKLSSLCQGKITTEAIDSISVKNIDINIFDITDAILNRDMQKAYKLSDAFLKGDYGDFITLSGVLFNFVGSLYKIKVLSDAGKKPYEIASELKMNEYVVKKNSRALDSIPLSRLDTFVDKCTAADLALKSTSIDPRIILTTLIEELAL
ncbi:MAG: DNA polymerase III subunit delta [Clostridiales bacterium]|nr:MAG: DNA polymerase III subunit delta [Clostridiales bacterium]